MQPIYELKKKYPKLCFMNVHPNKNLYYTSKEEANINLLKTKELLKKKIGMDKYSDLMNSQLIKKLNEINPKIPLVDFDLYY
jgi:hypothetical protein